MKELGRLLKSLFWIAIIISFIFYYIYSRDKFFKQEGLLYLIKIAQAAEEIFIQEPLVIYTDQKVNYLNIETNIPNYYPEIKLLIFDKNWIRAYSEKVTINLPGPGVYAVLIRARNYKNNKVTKTYYRFFVSSASIYQDRLSFYYSSDGKSLQIYNKSKLPINITGFKIISKNIGEFVIPKATKIVTPSLLPVDEDIILLPGESAIIKSEMSPLGFNFRPNQCFGYLRPFYQNLPYFGYCQPFSQEDLYQLREKENLSQNCLNFLQNLSCTIPQNKLIEPRCLEIAQKYVNYSSCFNRLLFTKNFLDSRYYIYFPTAKLFETRFSEVKILDKENYLIDKKIFY